jgi:hypothetical protein
MLEHASVLSDLKDSTRCTEGISFNEHFLNSCCAYDVVNPVAEVIITMCIASELRIFGSKELPICHDTFRSLSKIVELAPMMRPGVTGKNTY